MNHRILHYAVVVDLNMLLFAFFGRLHVIVAGFFAAFLGITVDRLPSMLFGSCGRDVFSGSLVDEAARRRTSRFTKE